jgi:hypothetical protein
MDPYAAVVPYCTAVDGLDVGIPVTRTDECPTSSTRMFKMRGTAQAPVGNSNRTPASGNIIISPPALLYCDGTILIQSDFLITNSSPGLCGSSPPPD